MEHADGAGRATVVRQSGCSFGSLASGVLRISFKGIRERKRRGGKDRGAFDEATG